jgi:hypothetical protein
VPDFRTQGGVLCGQFANLCVLLLEFVEQVADKSFEFADFAFKLCDF